MDRQFFLDLAHSGLRMPIGTDLVLHEHADHEQIMKQGESLGRLMAEAAGRYHTPLALPVMNLELEKQHLLELLDLGGEERATFHFAQAPGAELIQRLQERLCEPLSERMQAVCGALEYLSQQTNLVPVGMCIGPFSLMTKLLSDPITPIAMAGMGLTAAEDPGITAVEQVLEVAMLVIRHYIKAQIASGARAIFMCEPAANVVYLSPRQIEHGSDIFERFVLRNLVQIRHLLLEHDVELFFHDCGELTDSMVEAFGRLDPALLSLGSSRKLWEDAQRLPKDVVLFGNLPSKRFYSDREITVDEVRAAGQELLERMAQAGHPFILGSECDVLSVPGCEPTLHEKTMAIVHCCSEHAVCTPGPVGACADDTVAAST